MNTSTKFKDLTIIQKAEAAFIPIAGLITIAQISGAISDFGYILNIIVLLGFLLYLIPFLLKRIKSSNKNTTQLLLLLVTSFNLSAQDYSKQVEDFKQCFTNKSIERLQPHLSAKLKFEPMPATSTPMVLTNIVSKLPRLNKLSIIENEKGKVKVKYDFEALGISESYIYFDDNGKITRIEFVENLIKQEIKAQKQLQQSVKLPTFGEYEKKHMPRKVEFKAKDGLIVNGNLYEVDKTKPVILLSHQAGYNRIEYRDIAPRLNELGYNCMAIDQRSGGNFAGKQNHTFQRATEKGLSTNFIDAQQDIEAAIDFLYDKYKQKIIIWGSSYSSSLVLFESLKNKKVKASISFSPGDYFGDEILSLSNVFKQLKKPFFVTSSKQESKTLKTLVGNKNLKENQLQFIPKSNGFHGSRSLWTGQKGAEEYWKAVTVFLTQISK